MSQSPMRVLHVVGAMNRGGAESMIMALYRGLDPTKAQFDFLEFSEGVSDFSGEIAELGGRLLKCEWSQSPAAFMSTLHRITKVIKEEGPYQSVHSHILFGSGTVLAAARAAGVPARIAHSHSTSDAGDGLMLHGYRALSRWLIYRNSTSMVACSADAGRYLFGDRFFRDGGVVVPNAVDLETFHPRQVSGSKPLVGKRVSLVAVARLEPVKNHQFLVELAEELRARGVDFEMRFVGTGSLTGTLRESISKRGLGDQVAMLGLREDIDEILRESNALLLPSLWEGLPVTLVEAQATGLPCLVSDAVSRESDLGLGLLKFLPVDSVAGWADAIQAGFPPRPHVMEISQALHARGYTVPSSLKRLLPLYSFQCGGIGL